MWYAITEYLWGSPNENGPVRSKRKLEEGWVLVDIDRPNEKVC